MAITRIRRKQHYNELMRRHFIHVEAREFSVAKTLNYDEFHKMTAIRQLLWNGFIRTHPKLERGTRQFHISWTQYVVDWYVNHDLDTYDIHMRRVVSPWSWFDKVSYQLPEEMRYTKSSRRKRRGGRKERMRRRDSGLEEAPAARAWRERWIHQLKATLEKHPDRARELVPQILRLDGRVSTEWKRKAGIQ